MLSQAPPVSYLEPLRRQHGFAGQQQWKTVSFGLARYLWVLDFRQKNHLQVSCMGKYLHSGMRVPPALCVGV